MTKMELSPYVTIRVMLGVSLFISVLTTVNLVRVTRRSPSFRIVPVTIAVAHKTTKTILVVETRDTSVVLPTLRSVLQQTSPEWTVTLIHPLRNHDHTHDELKALVAWNNRTLFVVPFDFQIGQHVHRDISALLMNPVLWQRIPADHVLVVQHDSVMCGDGIDAWLDYDYVGAAWSHRPDGLDVGNGGFSLRSRRFMEWCAANYTKHRNDPEDVFYANCVAEHGRVPTKKLASGFSMEAVWHPAPMALHKFWWAQILATSKKTKAEVKAAVCAHCPAVASVPGVGVTCSPPPRTVEWTCHARDQQSGTFKQLRYAMESLQYAVKNRIHWKPSMLGSSIHSDCEVEFGSIVDLMELRRAFQDTILDTSIPTTPVTIDCGPSTRTCVHDPKVWSNILQTVRPSAPLRRIVAQIVGAMPRFVCLHARIEKDFESMFKNSPRFKTVDQLRHMMKAYDFGDVDTLYVAGGDFDRTRWNAIGFGSVVSKNYTATKSLEGAMVDMEVCKRAAIHVGTGGSIWDEWLHEWRHVNRMPTLMYAADREVTRLEQFVGANDASHLGRRRII